MELDKRMEIMLPSSHEEAVNLLDGKNADGSEFTQLPF